MGKEKIVIDTNNLISALGWEGKSRELLRRVIDREYELAISMKQILELKRVMNYPKFNFTEEQRSKFIKILFEIASIVDPKTRLSIVEDPNDNMLVECAVEARADYLISGDAHLKKIKRFRGVKIVSVGEFLKK
jgi:putative PIN family toxin of toxin-antitoxin system